MTSPVRLKSKDTRPQITSACVPTPTHTPGRDWYHAEWWSSLHADVSPNVISNTSTFLRLKEDTETDDRMGVRADLDHDSYYEAMTDASGEEMKALLSSQISRPLRPSIISFGVILLCVHHLGSGR